MLELYIYIYIYNRASLSNKIQHQLHAAKYAWENNDFNNDHYGGLVSYEEYPYDNFFGERKSNTCETVSKTPVAFLNYPKVVNSVNDRSTFEQRRDLMLTAVARQPVPMTLKS